MCQCANVPTASLPKRARLSVDLTADERRRIKLAAAHRDQSIREYVISAIETQLARDPEATGLTALDARADAVLADLWHNAQDAAYDDL
mgnify:FL=1